MKLLAFAIASLPILAKAMALGLAEDGPGGGQHLEARREPIYPTKVTVRARAPIYPTKVTVRARGDLEPSEVTPVEQDLEKRRPPKITLKTVKAKRSDDGDDCPIRRAATPTTVTTVSSPCSITWFSRFVPHGLGLRLCWCLAETFHPMFHYALQATDEGKPYETVICKPCPPGKVCPAVCIPITVSRSACTAWIRMVRLMFRFDQQ